MFKIDHIHLKSLLSWPLKCVFSPIHSVYSGHPGGLHQQRARDKAERRGRLPSTFLSSDGSRSFSPFKNLLKSLIISPVRDSERSRRMERAPSESVSTSVLREGNAYTLPGANPLPLSGRCVTVSLAFQGGPHPDPGLLQFFSRTKPFHTLHSYHIRSSVNFLEISDSFRF